MPLHTMKDLLIDQLNELYAAEKHSTDVFPRLARAASNPKLVALLRTHAQETREHVSRLETVFHDLGAMPRTRTCAESCGMKGLTEDCLKLAGMAEAEPHVRDAAIIAVAQHVEHDELAGYGCARTWATLIGLEKAASLLQKSLSDERKADTELTRLAETINRTALAAAPV